MPRVPNLALRRIREEERQETRREFAEAMMRTACRLGESISPSERYVARLEDGDVRYPTAVYRRVLTELCKRSMSELGFASPLARKYGLERNDGEMVLRPGPADEGVTGAAVLPASPREARSADACGAFTPDDEERLILAAREPRQHDPRVIGALAAILAEQRRAEDVIGSAPLIEPVRAQLMVVQNLVTEARGDVRTGILDIGSQWSQFAGWLAANMGRLEEAGRFYHLALEWATEADKPNMVATALSMQGHAAWLRASVGPMIGLSEAAQRDKRISPGVRALAVQQEARGLSLSGGAKIGDVNRRLDEAERLAVRAAENPDDEPPWIYFFSRDYLVLQRGLAYRLLGHYAEANKLLTEGLASIPADMRKSEWVASHYLLQLAITYAQAADVTQACKLAREAEIIARQTDSARLRSDLSRFGGRMMARWPENHDVIELNESIALMTSSR